MQKTKSIHTIIIVLFMIGLGFLPPIGAMTPFGMKILAIFIGLIYAWTLGLVIWPSMLAIILLATVQPGTTFLAVLSACFGNQTLWQCVWAIIFCYAINKCGLMTVIGRWLVSRRFVKKGPFWLVSTFWLACYILSVLTLNSVPPMLMLWSVYFEVMRQLGISKFSAYSNIVMIGMAVIAYLGSVFFPFSPWAIIINGIFASTGETALPSYGAYFAFAALVSLVYFILALAFSKFIIRPAIDFDVSLVQAEGDARLTLNCPQKVALGCLLGMFIFLMLPSLLSDTWLLTLWLNKIGFVGAFIIVILILSFVPSAEKPGEKAIDLLEVVKNGMNWSQFFLLALAFYMATLLTSESTGISALLAQLVSPLLTGRSALATIAIVVIGGAVITNCINNVVTASILIPIAIAYCALNGVSPTILCLSFSIILIQGCVLPSGSAMGGVLHSSQEWLRPKDIYLYAALYTLLLAVIVTLLGWLLGPILL